jgi:hypothetical protein
MRGTRFGSRPVWLRYHGARGSFTAVVQSTDGIFRNFGLSFSHDQLLTRFTVPSLQPPSSHEAKSFDRMLKTSAGFVLAWLTAERTFLGSSRYGLSLGRHCAISPPSLVQPHPGAEANQAGLDIPGKHPLVQVLPARIRPIITRRQGLDNAGPPKDPRHYRRPRLRCLWVPRGARQRLRTNRGPVWHDGLDRG